MEIFNTALANSDKIAPSQMRDYVEDLKVIIEKLKADASDTPWEDHILVNYYLKFEKLHNKLDSKPYI